jgi:hypothetical protein
VTDDLVAWLREQIAKDRRIAEAASVASGGRWFTTGPGLWDRAGVPLVTPSSQQRPHIARWDPDRVLAQCDATERIIEIHAPYISSDLVDDQAVNRDACSTCDEIIENGYVRNATWPCATMRLLALPFADRPGYREEWRP